MVLDLEAFARAVLGTSHARHQDAPDAPATPPLAPRPAKDDLVWHESSFELSRGLDMTEQPIDTLPGELRALFRGK
ncbi:MAG: hypothetical protein V4792_16665 [Pseudomonadota bacterium]